MRPRLWHVFAIPLAVLLSSSGAFTVRGDEGAELRAVRLIEESGGTVTRDENECRRPVVAVSLCGVKLSDEVVKSLTTFPHLQALDLCRADGVTSRRIKMLADLKELQVLNVSRCPNVTGHGLYKLAALKHLRVLDVSYCPEIDDCGLEALVEFFPKLESLDISGCKSITARGLRELHCLPNLVFLNASHCDFADAEFAEIGGTPGLKTLSVAGNGRVSVNGVKLIAALANLEVLDLSGMPAATSASLRSISGLKKLHTLNLSNCPRMANHSLKQLSPMKQLHTLNLSGCTQLEDYGLEYLVNTLPNLQSLDLSGCLDITDAGVKVLTRLDKLETLDLRRCKGVSNNGFKTLSTAFPNLSLCR